MVGMTDPEAIELARSVRPQEFGGGSRTIADAVIEPLWSGIRVIVGAAGGRAAMFQHGEPLTTHAHLAEAFASVVLARADGVIVEAWLTRQIASDDTRVYTGPDDEMPSTGRFLGRVLLGSRADRVREATSRMEEDQAARIIATDEPVNLVVVDLLWLDGTWLLDVPLLERKRLVESVVPAGELVRPGIHVRPPIDSWVGSWRAQGFSGLTFKAANSRYRPGERASDWATSPMPRR